MALREDLRAAPAKTQLTVRASALSVGIGLYALRKSSGSLAMFATLHINQIIVRTVALFRLAKTATLTVSEFVILHALASRPGVVKGRDAH